MIELFSKFVCSFVAETIDVSNTGSQISVINGQTGQYMVRATRSVSTAFEALRNMSGSCKNKVFKKLYEKLLTHEFPIP